MVALTPIRNLIKQRDELINILKTQHADLYSWMIEHNVDPMDLKAYSVGLAAALSIALSAAHPEQQTQAFTLVPQVDVIEINELVGKNEEEKAKLVWERYGHVIERSAKKYEVDPKLIFATIMIESGGNTFAIRQEPRIGDASYGLGQILYGTARGIGFEGSPQDLYDPEVNIELISKYHARNRAVYGDLTAEQLTIAYNAGSPYSSPHPGHLTKFNKWFERASQYVG